MKVVPLGDNVVVRRLESACSTSGGILLPDSAHEKPQEGRVLSVGDGRRLPDGSRLPHLVHEGDRILFTRYAGIEVAVGSEELIIISEDEILAIMP